MNKSIQLAIKVNSRTIDGQSVLHVHVPPNCLDQWTLCLQLLHDELVDCCVLFAPAAQFKLELRCETSSTHLKMNATNVVCLSPQALDCLRCFFLKYFRDGFAEVDHVDIDDDVQHGGYLTFSVSEYSHPISGEELRKRLGLA